MHESKRNSYITKAVYGKSSNVLGPVIVEIQQQERIWYKLTQQ